MPSQDELYTIPITTIDGEDTTLAPYRGQILLIVNVASRCGFTSQYAELETLYQDYHARGVSVLGFPCNQFLRQEPGSNQDIKQFAESCFRVTFPLFGKIQVKGSQQAPLYQFLAQHVEKKSLVFIPWNFTKILVDANGRVLKRYSPTASFELIRNDIDRLLKKYTPTSPGE